MAEKSYQDLAPFGGITRIRFKGFVQDVSAVSAPPLFRYAKVRIKNYKVGSGEAEVGRARLPRLFLLPS